MKYNKLESISAGDAGGLDSTLEVKIAESGRKLTLVHTYCPTRYFLPSTSSKSNYKRNGDHEKGQDQFKAGYGYEAPSALSIYLKTINGFHLLSEEEERILAKGIKECEEECKRLVIQWKHIFENAFMKSFSSGCNEEKTIKLQQINASMVLFNCLAELENERKTVNSRLKKEIKNPAVQEKLQGDLYRVEAGIAKCIAKISCSKVHINETVYNLMKKIPEDRQLTHKHNNVKNDLGKIADKICELAQDIKELKTKFVHANQKLVTDIAKKYSRYGLELPDLIQEGNLGLLRAIDTFDYRRGYRFISYAKWWIRQAIIRSLQGTLRTIRKPNHMNEKLSKIVKTSKRLFQECKREPSLQEIAKEINLSPESIEQVLHCFNDTISMDTLIEEGRESESTNFSIQKRNPTLETIIFSGLSKYIHAVLSELSQREREVVTLRFGIGGCDHHTLEEIGQKFDFTRERSRQILESALRKMRKSKHMTELKDFRNSN